MLNSPEEGQSVLEAKVAGRADVEFAEVLQKDMQSSRPDKVCDAEFALGVSLGVCFGELTVDGGDGPQRLSMARNAAYLNYPYDHEQHTIVEGQAHILLVTAPHAALADRLQIDASAIENALLPLHETMLASDSLLRPLSLAMWRASMTHGQMSDLFVDQALDTLVLHTLSLARGPSWGQKSFLDGERSSLEDKLYSSPKGSFSRTRMKMVEDYIEANIGNQLRVADLASLVGMSSSSFSKTFKATFGEPAWSYVRRRRAEIALDLLQHSSFSIAEIAFKTGFSSQAHLSTVIKEIWGQAPGAFRS